MPNRILYNRFCLVKRHFRAKTPKLCIKRNKSSFKLKTHPFPAGFPLPQEYETPRSSPSTFILFVACGMGSRRAHIQYRPLIMPLALGLKQHCPIAAYLLCATRLDFANNRYTPQLWCLALHLALALRVLVLSFAKSAHRIHARYSYLYSLRA